MDTKNIPVSIYAHYKCLPFLYNKQFTTHPLTVNLLAVHVLLSESHCPLATCAKARLSCLDRSL